jgi:hypothetical protein
MSFSIIKSPSIIGIAQHLLPDISINLSKPSPKYLILFQNNLELRPAGGYIGNFGILKVKNGQIVSLETHDTNIFDGFGKKQTERIQFQKILLRQALEGNRIIRKQGYIRLFAGRPKIIL